MKVEHFAFHSDSENHSPIVKKVENYSGFQLTNGKLIAIRFGKVKFEFSLNTSQKGTEIYRVQIEADGRNSR